METASNTQSAGSASQRHPSGMSEAQWREAIKFDSIDTGWIIMSIGMTIGAGIVFLPVQVGPMGLSALLHH